MKDELSGKIMKEFVGLRAKIYSYFTDDNDESKKAKGTKNCVTKRKFKNEDYKSVLQGSHLENKIKYLEKNEIDVKNLDENHKDFIINNKLILKLQQIFKSEKN